jgi:hypothetical protein
MTSISTGKYLRRWLRLEQVLLSLHLGLLLLRPLLIPDLDLGHLLVFLGRNLFLFDLGAFRRGRRRGRRARTIDG